jgi:ArsR family metal-binding transcriptional regulator
MHVCVCQMLQLNHTILPTTVTSPCNESSYFAFAIKLIDVDAKLTIRHVTVIPYICIRYCDSSNKQIHTFSVVAPWIGWSYL